MDPWFEFNDWTKDVYLIKDETEMALIQTLIDMGQGDTFKSYLLRLCTVSMLNQQILQQRIARRRAMAAEQNNNNLNWNTETIKMR